jgi:thiamine pyrophosphokinase
MRMRSVAVLTLTTKITPLVFVTSMPSAVKNPVHLSSMQQRRVIRSPFAATTDDETAMAMILLNVPLQPTPLFHTLWNLAKFHICADGAANRLRSLNERNGSSSSSSSPIELQQCIPDLIIGDLDSITDETKAYYHNVPTVQVIDQDRNDLDKALEAAESYRRVVVFGAFGGRFDQQMASVQSLYCYPGREIFLYTDTSMAVLVHAGETSIFLGLEATKTKNNSISEGPTCGLIPIGQPVRSMTTTGLRWNFNQQGIEFGGLVSTSNQITENEVTISSSEPFVFTAEMHCGCAAEW